jgi:sugar phosphate isomerase/epimerase
VTHIDVDAFNHGIQDHIKNLISEYEVNISGLGYYPNPLTSNKSESQTYIDHIKKVIDVAHELHIPVVNTFIGRDHKKSVDDNWPRFIEVWSDIIAHAEGKNVKVAIENCPMLFTDDEWPGGKNLATTPSIWNRMFSDIRSDHFGLNYDPSHFIWQHMNYLNPIRDFSDRFFHLHAKDVRIDRDRLDQHGIMSPPNLWHTPKLPGMGDVDWGKFFSILTSVGYKGAVCVEVEDRAFEGDLNLRIQSLIQSHTFLRQYIPKKPFVLDHH